MPAHIHPVFKHPATSNVPIWRYMDFTKFVSMLEQKALYLCRADLLGDPFEGSIPRQTLEAFREALAQGQTPNEQVTQMLQSQSEFRRGFRKEVYLNCWHASDVESAAMWNLYSKSSEAIAIQSTFGSLFNSIESDEKTGAFYLGLVRYIDYEQDHIELNNIFWPFVHKRKSFEHEKEVRIVHSYPAKIGEKWADRETPPGIWKPVDLDRLISRIFVSPTCDSWFCDLVQKTTTRYGLSKNVLQSDMNATPVY